MSTTPTRPGGTTAPSLKDRLDQLNRELARERRRTQRATALTLVVGLIVVALLSGYFAYGYIKIAPVIKPQFLLDVAEDTIQRELPKGRVKLEEQIIKSSPEWAQRLSQQALDN